jgi:hypothetical protein
MEFSSIEAAIDDIREGKIVIVVDDEDRENEGGDHEHHDQVWERLRLRAHDGTTAERVAYPHDGGAELVPARYSDDRHRGREARNDDGRLRARQGDDRSATR